MSDIPGCQGWGISLTSPETPEQYIFATEMLFPSFKLLFSSLISTSLQSFSIPFEFRVSKRELKQLWIKIQIPFLKMPDKLCREIIFG
jgi:hypothetical protein